MPCGTSAATNCWLGSGSLSAGTWASFPRSLTAILSASAGPITSGPSPLIHSVSVATSVNPRAFRCAKLTEQIVGNTLID